MNLLIDVFSVLIVVIILAFVITYERLDKRRFKVKSFMENNCHALLDWAENLAFVDGGLENLLYNLRRDIDLEDSRKADSVSATIDSVDAIIRYLRKGVILETEEGGQFSQALSMTKEFLKDFEIGYSLVCNEYNTTLKRSISFMAKLLKFKAYPAFPVL